jgi:hypothetical protein
VLLRRLALAVMICGAFQGAAAAQGMLVASVGKVYGGDAQSGRGTFAIGVGGGGAHHIGSELEFCQTSHFIDQQGTESKVLSLMAGIFVAAPAGPLRPYGVFGFGFIRQRTSASTGFVLSNLTNNEVGYSAGGGVIYRFSRVAGVRADLRHFKVRTSDGLSFQRFTVGIVLGS